jgi:uncharacterized protein YndB with AHSA1/START domain
VSDPRVGVRLTRRYDASPAEVWAALTEPVSLARWLARTQTVELFPGGAFELRFTDDESTWVAGQVTEVEHEGVLELDWRHPGEQPSIVRFELAADGDGTVLVVDHRRLEERLGLAYAAGWRQHLDRLESCIETSEVPR